MTNNPLIVGPLGASSEGYFASITGRWNEIGDLRLSQVAALMGSALTLAVLLSIDTLKTCVVLDQMTRSQHDPNRELIAQGIANVASSSVGGVPGAGTMGATLVNLSSGATTRASGRGRRHFGTGLRIAAEQLHRLDSRLGAGRHPDRRRPAHDRPRAHALHPVLGHRFRFRRGRRRRRRRP
jgi:hypothetical protein